jgi:coenzyme F420-0:L-glutamate ligase/coenzyme F420-1:gamma-L-glutamate ligase
MLNIEAVEGLPEIAAGDDLAAAIAGAVRLMPGDVLVVAHKVVSKAEGRVRALASIDPGPRARELAAQLGKDPRHVQAVLDESRSVVRTGHGVLICETHHGFICANAGVDASNAARENELVLLPRDPDGSARRLRARLRELSGVAPAVVITDSFGRAWRHGQVDVAIGCAGLEPLEDWRGRHDARGRELRATAIAIADELAAAADLARLKDAGQPVIVIRGLLHRSGRADDGPGVAALIRPPAKDLFR